MSETMPQARIVRIEYEKGRTGLIYATSPELKGLLVGRPTIEELESVIPQAISDMYLACGVRVFVSRVQSDEFIKQDSWVAFPAEIAAQAQKDETTGAI